MKQIWIRIRNTGVHYCIPVKSVLSALLLNFFLSKCRSSGLFHKRNTVIKNGIAVTSIPLETLHNTVHPVSLDKEENENWIVSWLLGNFVNLFSIYKERYQILAAAGAKTLASKYVF